MFKRPPYFKSFKEFDDNWKDVEEIKEEQDRFWEGADLTLSAKLPHTIQAMIVYHVGDIKMDLVCWRYFHYVSTWCTYVDRTYDDCNDKGLCTKISQHLVSPFCVVKTINSISLSTEKLMLHLYVDDSKLGSYKREVEEEEENEEDEDGEDEDEEENDYIIFKDCKKCPSENNSSIAITKQRYNEISLYPSTTATTTDTTTKENIKLIESQLLQSIEYLDVKHTSYSEISGEEDLHLLLMNLPNLKSLAYDANPDDCYTYFTYTIKLLGGRKNVQAIYDCDDKAPDHDNNEISHGVDRYLVIDTTIPIILEELCIATEIDQLSIIKLLAYHQSKIQHFSSSVYRYSTSTDFITKGWNWFINQLESINLLNKQDMIVRFIQRSRTPFRHEMTENILEVSLMDINDIEYSKIKDTNVFEIYNKYYQRCNIDHYYDD